MWKIKKIFKIVLGFIGIWILAVAFVAVIQVANLPLAHSNNILDTFLSRMGNNALFFLGYGDTELNIIIKNILAIIGILAVSVMTTFLTIDLFWRVDDVLIVPKMFITSGKDKMGRESYYANFVIVNRGKRIADLRLSIVAYLEQKKKDSRGPSEIEREEISRSKEYSNPMLLSQSIWTINQKLQDSYLLDTLYKQFAEASHSSEDKQVTLYLVLRFVDTKSGQDCCNITDIRLDDIYPCDNICISTKRTYRQFKKIKPQDELINQLRKYVEVPYKPFDYTKLETIPGNRFSGRGELPDHIDIDFEKIPNDERWPMIFLNYRGVPLDWTIYNDDEISLVCDLKVTGIMNNLMLELKSGPDKYVFFRNALSIIDNEVHFSMKLSNIIENSKSPTLTDIREINIVIDRGEGENQIMVDGHIHIVRFGLEYNY